MYRPLSWCRRWIRIQITHVYKINLKTYSYHEDLIRLDFLDCYFETSVFREFQNKACKSRRIKSVNIYFFFVKKCYLKRRKRRYSYVVGTFHFHRGIVPGSGHAPPNGVPSFSMFQDFTIVPKILSSYY